MLSVPPRPVLPVRAPPEANKLLEHHFPLLVGAVAPHIPRCGSVCQPCRTAYPLVATPTFLPLRTLCRLSRRPLILPCHTNARPRVRTPSVDPARKRPLVCPSAGRVAAHVAAAGTTTALVQVVPVLVRVVPLLPRCMSVSSSTWDVWDVGCGMWDVGCGMWDVGCGLWRGRVGCGMWFVAWQGGGERLTGLVVCWCVGVLLRVLLALGSLVHNADEEELETLLKEAIASNPYVKNLCTRLEIERFPDPGRLSAPADPLAAMMGETTTPGALGAEPTSCVCVPSQCRGRVSAQRLSVCLCSDKSCLC